MKNQGIQMGKQFNQVVKPERGQGSQLPRGGRAQYPPEEEDPLNTSLSPARLRALEAQGHF